MFISDKGEHEPLSPQSSEVRPTPTRGVRTRAINLAAQPTAIATHSVEAAPQGVSAPTNALNTQSAPPKTATEDGTHITPEYWPRKWLSNAPTPLTPTVVPYPETLSSSHEEGWVILELFISAEGQVDKVDVLSSDAPDEFIESARLTFWQSSFNPGLKDKVPVPSRIKIEVRYK